MDCHKVLGVRRRASKKEIQEAYRRLALRFHPDRNKEAGAEERFREISTAYAVLSGKEKPPAETAPGHACGRPAAQAGTWAEEIVGIWMGLERERHNNMYR